MTPGTGRVAHDPGVGSQLTPVPEDARPQFFCENFLRRLKLGVILHGAHFGGLTKQRVHFPFSIGKGVILRCMFHSNSTLW